MGNFVHHFFYPILASALLLTACTSIPNEAGSIELRPVGGKTFAWNGRLLSISDLTAELSLLDETQPIKRINLRNGETSATVADVVDIAVLARALGAVSFVEKDGKLQSVELEITE